MSNHQRTAWYFLGIAFIIAILTEIGLLREVHLYRSNIGTVGAMWVARTKILPYTPITAEMLVSVPIPKRYAPSSAIQDAGEIIGKISLVTLKKGDLITVPMLHAPNLGDQRLITLAEGAGGTVAIDKGITMENRVDVLVAYHDGQKEVVTYLLTDAEIASMNDQSSERSITLIVTKKQAKDLVYMENFGKQIRIVGR